MTEGKADIFRVITNIVSILIICVILKLGASIFVKIAIASFFALLMSPTVKKTTLWTDNLLRRLFKSYRRRSPKERSGLADIVGTAVVLIMAFAIISVFFFLIYGALSMMVGRKDDMISNVIAPVVSFSETAQNTWIPSIYTKIGITPTDSIQLANSTIISDTKPQQSSADKSSFSLTSIVPTAAGFLGSLSSGLFDSIIIIMLTVFMVNGRNLFSKKIASIDSTKHERYRKLVSAIERIPRKYLLAKLVTSALTGLLVGVSLVIMKFQPDEAIIWGTTAMVFNFIPFFGSLAAGIMISLYVMSVQGIQSGVIAAVVFLVINNVVSNVIEPNYFGDVLPIGKVTILLSVIIWGYIWGILGVFLAVPLTIIIKVLLEHTVGRNSFVVFMEV